MRFLLAIGVWGMTMGAAAQPRRVGQEAPSDGAPAMEVVRVEGPITQERVRTGVEDATARFERCWRRDAGSLRGRFELSLITAPDGRVVRARVLADELKLVRDGQERRARSTTRCYERAAARLRFRVQSGANRPVLLRLAIDFGSAGSTGEDPAAGTRGGEGVRPEAPPPPPPPEEPAPQPGPQRQVGPVRLPRHAD
jgi:hypothetical protein